MIHQGARPLDSHLSSELLPSVPRVEGCTAEWTEAQTPLDVNPGCSPFQPYHVGQATSH